MQRGLLLFVVIVISWVWACSLLAWVLQEQLGRAASGLLFALVSWLPLLTAFACQRMINRTTTPFNGLKFGSLHWLLRAWLGGLAVGYIAAAICVLFGLHRLDLTLRDYQGQLITEYCRVGEMPADYADFLMDAVYRQLFLPPLLYVWLYAAVLCLFTFPILGWFARRLAVGSVRCAMLITAGLVLLATAAAGLLEMPALPEAAIWQRMLFTMAPGVCAVPGAFWLLLRSRSAIVPALAFAAMLMALSGSLPLIAGPSPFLGLPYGLVSSAVMLLAGLGLWVWQNPNGEMLHSTAAASEEKQQVPASQPRR